VNDELYRNFLLGIANHYDLKPSLNVGIVRTSAQEVLLKRYGEFLRQCRHFLLPHREGARAAQQKH